MAPILAVAATAWLTWRFDWHTQGLETVGAIPGGLPPLKLPDIQTVQWQPLLTGALLISMVGFIESVSVGYTLAAKKLGSIDPNQELIGLGAANLGSAFSGGMPVTGGFSRSVVNDDGGAQTPAAGAFTALGIVAVIAWFTPWLSPLPLATLAATIIVAVLPLADIRSFIRTWHHDKADFAAMAATAILTLVHSVESGILTGIGLSVLLYLYRAARPHTAELGKIGGSEHFRNIKRHTAETLPQAVFIRIDESLYFPNARFLEEHISHIVHTHPKAEHIVLVCSAVNHVDTSALESLSNISSRLKESDLHEIRPPSACHAA